jgi:O-acetyl-ADP-ribose deacetylase (regulator of RNase III)
LTSVAFPAISTGIYAFPAERAAAIAVRTVAGVLARDTLFKEIVFCCFGERSAELHRQSLQTLNRR